MGKIIKSKIRILIKKLFMDENDIDTITEKAEKEIRESLPSEGEILNKILEYKYPKGLPVLVEERKGGKLGDFYTKENELSKQIKALYDKRLF